VQRLTSLTPTSSRFKLDSYLGALLTRREASPELLTILFHVLEILSRCQEMNDSASSQSILESKIATTERALALFDTLAPASLDFMFGRWQGSGLHTSHPMDGLLEASNWYGKEFIDSETVHPLLFLNGRGEIVKIAPNPTLMNWALKLPVIESELLKFLLGSIGSLLKTEASQARLRMMEYRGKASATMVYDYLPINDSFRKVDENTALGVMDFKASPQPFFFILRRCPKV